jgi:hypothetical protein
MARKFSTRTDIDKTELAKYPDGRIKEGIADGTLWDEAVTGDFYQVFLKAMRDAGITPNGLPDNQTNGWQMFEACFGTEWKTVGADGGATTFLNGASSSGGSLNGGQNIRYRKINGGKCVQLDGWFNAASTGYETSFILPVGYRPSGSLRFPVKLNDGSDSTLDIFSTDGVVRTEFGTNSVCVSVIFPLD